MVKLKAKQNQINRKEAATSLKRTLLSFQRPQIEVSDEDIRDVIFAFENFFNSNRILNQTNNKEMFYREMFYFAMDPTFINFAKKYGFSAVVLIDNWRGLLYTSQWKKKNLFNFFESDE